GLAMACCFRYSAMSPSPASVAALRMASLSNAVVLLSEPAGRPLPAAGGLLLPVAGTCLLSGSIWQSFSGEVAERSVTARASERQKQSRPRFPSRGLPSSLQCTEFEVTLAIRELLNSLKRRHRTEL